MARPKRIKPLKEGDRYELNERNDGASRIEIYANDNYHGDQCCVTILDPYNDEIATFQSTITELQLAINEFKKIRGLKRARRPSK